MPDKKTTPPEIAISVPKETILSRIYFIRGKKVMLDRDLAQLYGVETRALKQAVKRNSDRFPDDFMFQLNKNEFESWRSHFVISKNEKQGLRWSPFAFTEQGVAMLSSVLNSKWAIHVNIEIIRTFTRIRDLLATNTQLRRKIESMEQKYDTQLKTIFDTMQYLLKENETSTTTIGFKAD